jgi:hypothetical protein
LKLVRQGDNLQLDHRFGNGTCNGKGNENEVGQQKKKFRPKGVAQLRPDKNKG